MTHDSPRHSSLQLAALRGLISHGLPVLLSLLLLNGSAWAGAPKSINYQGLLLDKTGLPQKGPVSLQLRILDFAPATECPVLYEEKHNDAVRSGEITNDAVGASEIAAGAVGACEIDSSAVRRDEISGTEVALYARAGVCSNSGTVTRDSTCGTDICFGGPPFAWICCNGSCDCWDGPRTCSNLLLGYLLSPNIP